MLADFLTQAVRDKPHTALPPRLLLGRTRQGCAVKGEVGLVEITRQIARIAAQDLQHRIVLKDVQRRFAIELGFAGDRAGLRDQIGRAPRDAQRLHILRPGKARCLGGEIARHPLVIGLVRIAALDAGPMHTRQRLFEVEDGRCPGFRIGLARQRQHLGEIGLIGGADRRQLGVVLQIIVTVGQAQAALPDVRDIGVGRLVVLTDIDAERRTDALTLELGHLDGQRVAAVGRLDGVQPRLDRGRPLRVDGSLVHEAGIEVAGLVPRLLGGFVKDGAGLLQRAILQDMEHAVRRTIGGNRRVLVPGAVRIVEEVVARLHRRIAASHVETEIADLGTVLGIGLDRPDRRLVDGVPGLGGDGGNGGREKGGDQQRAHLNSRKGH